MPARVFISSSYKGTAGRGIVRAVRSSAGWEVKTLLERADVRSLASGPPGHPRVFAGTQGDGILRSDDEGETWSPAGLAGLKIKSIAVSPGDPNRIYAGVNPVALYRSDDGGQNWAKLEAFPTRWWWFSPAERPFSAYVQAITISPTDPEVVMAGIELGAVVRSEDGGHSWSGHLRNALRDCHSLKFHSKDGNWVYEAGGSGGGAAFSSDGGKTWQKAKEGLDRSYGVKCGADSSRPDVWYVAMSTGPNKATSWNDARGYIFRSVEAKPWERLSGGLPQPLDHMAFALLDDPNEPGHLYAGLSNGDIWHTSDRGDSWRKLDLSLMGIWRSLVMLT